MAATLARGDTHTIFKTWHWLRAWWESVGSGKLLLIGREQDGELVGVAPLYAHESMIFMLGAGDSVTWTFAATWEARLAGRSSRRSPQPDAGIRGT